jgi:hypothetical protein
LAIAIGWFSADTALAERIVTPPRPGQVGIGLQGQYGTMLESGNFGSDYGQGPGLAVRLRYRMRYERGLGLSFEGQRFDARVAPTGRDSVASASFFTAGADFYQMFGTRTRTTKMLSLGAGLAKVTVKTEGGENVYPVSGDGPYLSAGAGLERFFWRSWAADLSTRYMAVFHDGEVNHDFQISVGLIIYAAY